MCEVGTDLLLKKFPELTKLHTVILFFTCEFQVISHSLIFITSALFTLRDTRNSEPFMPCCGVDVCGFQNWINSVLHSFLSVVLFHYYL